MKPFDLKAAMNGEPVCTATGLEVQLYSFAAPLIWDVPQPIVGAMKSITGNWILASWSLEGSFIHGQTSDSDLRMASKTATWYIVSFLNGTQFGTHPTDDKRKAESLAAEYRANKYTNVEITEKVVTL